MGEFRLVVVLCAVVVLVIASWGDFPSKQQSVTKPSPRLDKTVPDGPVRKVPTHSEIINNAPLIAPIGKPEYSERFVEDDVVFELWYTVRYETQASYEEIDKQMFRYIARWEYELNPDSGYFESANSMRPGECGFSYFEEDGKNVVTFNHLRYFDPATPLEEAIAEF